MNLNYIADQINRIETQYANNPSAQLDSMWRIASDADLFQDLNPDGTLTSQQAAQVFEWIAGFKTGGQINATDCSNQLRCQTPTHSGKKSSIND